MRPKPAKQTSQTVLKQNRNNAKAVVNQPRSYTWCRRRRVARGAGGGGWGDRLGGEINWEEEKEGRIEDKAPTDYTKSQLKQTKQSSKQTIETP